MIASNQTCSQSSQPATGQAVRILHPEDLVVGDNVVITDVTYQYGTFSWYCLDSFKYPPDEIISLGFLAPGDHFPQKVVSICLPFVLCKQVDGKHTIHDVRSVRLGRLDSGFAKAARSAYRADKEAGDSAGKKKKKRKGKSAGKKKKRK